jgi:hypothetical protein
MVIRSYWSSITMTWHLKGGRAPLHHADVQAVYVNGGPQLGVIARQSDTFSAGQGVVEEPCGLQGAIDPAVTTRGYKSRMTHPLSLVPCADPQ